MSWLDPVRAALDEGPGTIFFRDDDAGWGDERLWALLDLFDRRSLPVDVAVIPAALHPALAAELTVRARAGGVRLHQHGWAHVNHEPVGRKCEFGPSRDLPAQEADVARGQAVLRDAFGGLLDPVFTPPWNRCTADTVAALAANGIAVLSRDSTAAPLPDAGPAAVVEVPITVDWFGSRKGVRWTPYELADRLAAAVRSGRPVGIMLHHAVTDSGELAALGALLALLSTHPHTRAIPLTTLAAVPG
jgi:peptidoglycan/xylan/chitin deacetylase (PgdA/CDA1 family)